MSWIGLWECASPRRGATPYLASLIPRRCEVMLAVGWAQDAAVDGAADRYRGVRFITIGGGPAPRVINIAPTPVGRLRVGVSTLLTATLRQVTAN